MKRFFAFMLCAALLSGVFVLPVNATEPCDCGEVVQVFLDGFGGPLFYNQGLPDQRRTGLIETDNLTVPILKMLGWLGLSAILPFSGKLFAKGVTKLLFGLMGHLRMDEQGRSIQPISNNWRIDKAKDHTQSPEYWFDYDWRICPFEAAAQLHAFIEELCEHTGHNKVALTGFSEGSSVAMTYISEYGTDRLGTLIIANGAWQGVTLVGELLTKQVALSGKSVTQYLACLPDESGWLAPSMKVLQALHLLDFVKPLAWGIVKFAGDPLYEQALIPLFCQMPAVWAFVPPEYYADARELIAGQAKYETLLTKIDKYHNEVQLEAKNLLLQAKEDGVKIAIVCGYGHAPIPATKAQDYHCDNLIDTARASGGATVAPYGKMLACGEPGYLSPDGIIDASTCLFPDYTWFMKGLIHEHGPTWALRKWVINFDGQPTIHDSQDFPQFLVK